LQVKVLRGRIKKMRIEKTGMTVIVCGLNVLFELCHPGGSACPDARIGSRGAVIEVVINRGGRLFFVDLRSGEREQAVRPLSLIKMSCTHKMNGLEPVLSPRFR